MSSPYIFPGALQQPPKGAVVNATINSVNNINTWNPITVTIKNVGTGLGDIFSAIRIKGPSGAYIKQIDHDRGVTIDRFVPATSNPTYLPPGAEIGFDVIDFGNSYYPPQEGPYCTMKVGQSRTESSTIKFRTPGTYYVDFAAKSVPAFLHWALDNIKGPYQVVAKVPWQPTKPYIPA